MSRLQWPLLGIVLLLIALGVAAIATATSESVGVSAAASDLSVALAYRPAKQVLFAGLGVTVCLLFAWMNYFQWRHFAMLAYAVCLAGLAGLWIYGDISHGARRWIPLGPLNLQPSEFMKIGLVLGLARFLMYRENLARWRGLLGPFLLTVIPMGLVLLQPDLGTALVFLPVFLAMVLVAGARPAHLMAAILLAAACVPIAYEGLLHDYQRKRIDVFFNPAAAPMAEGFQLLQAKRAVSAGGVWGSGGSIDTSPHFVPERHNDFIFTVIAEEWGFVGSTAVVLLYVLLLTLCLRIAWVTREPFGRLIVVGFTTMLAVQAFVNIGMTIGLAPVTGITMPFVSYGGSSLLASCVSAGLVLSVGGRWQPTFAGKDFADIPSGEIVGQRLFTAPVVPSSSAART